MKFLVFNFIILIGYFAFIANNETINDFKKVKNINQPAAKKITFDSYNETKVPITDYIEKDIQQLTDYKKEMLNKVDYIQKTLSSNEGVRKIAQKLSLQPKEIPIDQLNALTSTRI